MEKKKKESRSPNPRLLRRYLRVFHWSEMGKTVTRSTPLGQRICAFTCLILLIPRSCVSWGYTMCLSHTYGSPAHHAPSTPGSSPSVTTTIIQCSLKNSNISLNLFSQSLMTLFTEALSGSFTALRRQTSVISSISLGKQHGVCKEDELWRQITLSLTSYECWESVPYPLGTSV